MKKVSRVAWDEDEWVEERDVDKETIYNKEARDRMVEEGVIEAWEAAFLDGALDEIDWDPASWGDKMKETIMDIEQLRDFLLEADEESTQQDYFKWGNALPAGLMSLNPGK